MIQPLSGLTFGLDMQGAGSGGSEFGAVLWAAPQHARPKAGGFKLPEDTSALESAIQWDSDAMLRVHAARLFLSCSAAHQSNVLVNKDAELFSIDHATCIQTDAFEIKALFANIRRETRAWNALRDVARLDGRTVVDLLEGFKAFKWPLGSLWSTQDYFLSRLELWQKSFVV